MYDPNSGTTGTCAIPPAASVVKNVPVDNTVGTWEFEENLVNRLKNCATTAMVGQIVASYNAAPAELLLNGDIDGGGASDVYLNSIDGGGA